MCCIKDFQYLLILHIDILYSLTITSHFLLPPAPDNHHPTPCFYEFGCC